MIAYCGIVDGTATGNALAETLAFLVTVIFVAFNCLILVLVTTKDLLRRCSTRRIRPKRIRKKKKKSPDSGKLPDEPESRPSTMALTTARNTEMGTERGLFEEETGTDDMNNAFKFDRVDSDRLARLPSLRLAQARKQLRDQL